MNIVLSEEIAARTNIRSSCDRRTKNADNKNCDDVKGNLTTNKRRRGRTRAKTATGLQLFTSSQQLCGSSLQPVSCTQCSHIILTVLILVLLVSIFAVYINIVACLQSYIVLAYTLQASSNLLYWIHILLCVMTSLQQWTHDISNNCLTISCPQEIVLWFFVVVFIISLIIIMCNENRMCHINVAYSL